jgi:hypothetical protein
LVEGLHGPSHAFFDTKATQDILTALLLIGLTLPVDEELDQELLIVGVVGDHGR